MGNINRCLCNLGQLWGGNFGSLWALPIEKIMLPNAPLSRHYTHKAPLTGVHVVFKTSFNLLKAPYEGFYGVQNFSKLWKIGIMKWNVLIQYFFFFWKKLPIFAKKYWNSFHYISTWVFSLVAFLKLVYKLFRWVRKTYWHFMLNPSWDASQWHSMRKLKKTSPLPIKGIVVGGSVSHRNLTICITFFA
jgi:hypothetical protein